MERSVKIFLASLKSEETKKGYFKFLEKFRQSASFESYNEFIKKEPKEIQEFLENYLLKLREKANPNSIPTLYYPIQSFLEMNDVMINYRKLRKLFPEKTKSSVERGWTKEEIQKMLNVCDNNRARATILFEASSGGRIGLFQDLRRKYLKEMVDEKHGKCYAVIGYANSKEEYITFLTPEATKALDDYFQERQSKGEVITDESPVFLNTWTNDIASPQNLSNTVYYIQKKAGLRDPKDKNRNNHYAVPQNHGFRHRFNELIKSSNLINPHIAERLLSHNSKIIPLDTFYYKPDIDSLFLEYKKIIPILTISDEDRLRAENNSIKVSRSEYENMEKKYEDMQKKYDKMIRVLTNPNIRIVEPRILQ